MRAPRLWNVPRWSLAESRGLPAMRRLRLFGRALEAVARHPRSVRRLLHLIAELREEGIPVPVRELAMRSLHAQPSAALPDRLGAAGEQLEWLGAALRPASFLELLRGGALALGSVHNGLAEPQRLILLEETDASSEDGDWRLVLAAPPPFHHGERYALNFSCVRLQGRLTLAICRAPDAGRVAPRTLGGWHPACLLACVAAELAAWWDIELAVWNPPAADGSGADEGLRTIVATFCGVAQFPGWVRVPAFPVELLFAVSRSPEARELQAHRTDFWFRVRRGLRKSIRQQLRSPVAQARGAGLTHPLSSHRERALPWSEASTSLMPWASTQPMGDGRWSRTVPLPLA